MVQAQTTGALDFSRAVPDDRWWWRKVSWVLDHLETENRIRVLQARHLAVCSALGAAPDSQSASSLLDQAEKLARTLSEALLPWQAVEDKRSLQGAVRSMSRDWKAVYGDPEDPVVADKIRRTVAALYSGEWGTGDTT